MKRVLLAALLLESSGCARLQTETRLERGALLKTFPRVQVTAQAGIQGQVVAHWPALTVSFARYDLCRQERVTVYAEDHVTERQAPGAAPALASGIVQTLLGSGLLLAQGLFSGAPDRSHLDANGHYGPTPRTLARNWGLVLLGVGVPALAVGGFQLSQAGEKRESGQVEEIAPLDEAPCHQAPVDGRVEEEGSGQAPRSPVQTQGGSRTWSADALRQGFFEALLLDGQPVTFLSADEARLAAFRACVEVLPLPPREQRGLLATSRLEGLLESARRCNLLPGAPAQSALPVLSAELAERERHAGALVDAQSPAVHSYPEAEARYPTRTSWDATHPVPRPLPDSWVGKAVHLRGALTERMDSNLLVLQVGGQQVWLYSAPDSPWASLSVGSEVEAVAIVMGRQQVGALEAPLLRTLWLRLTP